MDEIFSAFNLLHGQFKAEPFGNGLINQTWRVKNSHDDFILQKVNHTIFKHPAAIAANVRRLCDYLSATHPGFLFTEPIKTKNNEEMAHIAGDGYYRLTRYIQGSHTVNEALKPIQAYEAAKKFGEFTKIFSAFPVDKLQVTLPDFHNLSLRYEQFTDVLKNGNKKRLIQSQGLINFIKANKKIVDTYNDILRNPAFKKRVTHHDTKISNVLLDEKDKGLCVIDLDTVMQGYFISDVGDMIRTYVSPVSEEEKDLSKIEIREEYFIAVHEGYMSEMINELSNEEKDHFIYAGKFMIYMQAIRFLTDHLNNDIYYGSKYKDHNLVRASNQAMLFRQLIKKEAKLRQLIL